MTPSFYRKKMNVFKLIKHNTVHFTREELKKLRVKRRGSKYRWICRYKPTVQVKYNGIFNVFVHEQRNTRNSIYQLQ